MRLDSYLAVNGLAKSRTRSAELISKGLVTVNSKPVTKPSFDVSDSDSVEVQDEEIRFVSRGGLKLDGALSEFGIDVSGMICADIGASTGGFTDCLLRRGAEFVYAVDSGHGQLDKTLADNPRVMNIEGTNARYIDTTVIPRLCDCAVADLSFISETLVIPAVSSLIKDDGIYIALIKPQFECGRENIGKGGIVKDRRQHYLAVKKVLDCAEENGLFPENLTVSPILGGDGNREFLFLARKNGKRAVFDKDIKETV